MFYINILTNKDAISACIKAQSLFAIDTISGCKYYIIESPRYHYSNTIYTHSRPR